MVAFPIDQFMGLKKGDSILDMMQQGEGDMQALKDQVAMAPDGFSPQMPPELIGKTMRELKAMGAKEIA